jgi:hypothetical protein
MIRPVSWTALQLQSKVPTDLERSTISKVTRIIIQADSSLETKIINYSPGVSGTVFIQLGPPTVSFIILLPWVDRCSIVVTSRHVTRCYKHLDQLQLPSSGDTGPRNSRKCSVIYIRVQFPLNKMNGASLGQQTIRTRQMLLGFNQSVQITSQFMSHDWELVVCMERQKRSEYFSRSYCKLDQNNVGYILYMPYLVSWRHIDGVAR